MSDRSAGIFMVILKCNNERPDPIGSKTLHFFQKPTLIAKPFQG